MTPEENPYAPPQTELPVEPPPPPKPVPRYLATMNILLTIWACGAGAVIGGLEFNGEGFASAYILGSLMGPIIWTGILMLPFQIAKPMRRPIPRAWTYFGWMLLFALGSLGQVLMYLSVVE